MPQFNYNNEPITSVNPSNNTTFGGGLTSEKYKHNIVNTKANNLSTLLTSISGSSYNVDYYSQVLGSSDELRPFDPQEVSVYRQYQRIQNYEFKLQDSINKNYDEKDNRLTASGSAITYPGLIPNKYDMFISDIGDGIAGLFTITSAVKKTYFQQTCYDISFELMYILDADIERKINSLIVKNTHFVKDYISFGSDPVMVDERYVAVNEMAELLTDTLAEYLSEFYSYELTTLLVPYDAMRVYDPFVVNFLLMIFDVNEHPLLAKIKQYNTDDPQLKKYIDIWSVLLKQQSRLLDNCFTKAQLIPVKRFSANPLLQTVAFSGIEKIVLPITNKPSIDDVLGIGRMNTYTDHIDESIPIITTSANEGDYTVPNVQNSVDYLFTPYFYQSLKQTPEQSDLENLIKKFLNKEHFDYKEVIGFVNQRDNWSSHQRFYLMPVLFLLLIYKFRSM